MATGNNINANSAGIQSYNGVGGFSGRSIAVVNGSITNANGVAGDPTITIPALTSLISQSSATRTLNSAYQVSSTRKCLAFYTVQIDTSFSLAGGQSGTIILEIASNSGFTTNVQTLTSGTNGQSGGLVVGVTINQSVALTVSGVIPEGYYARLRTVNNTSTPTFTFKSGQEVLL